MTWTDLVAPTLLAAAHLFLPGLVVLVAARVRGFLAVALAPGVSTTAIALGAVVGGRLGLPWGWWTPWVTAIALAVAVGVGGGLARRYLGAPTVVQPWWGGREELPLWLGALIAVALWLRHLKNILGHPDAFSQTFDNVFHLAAVRYIVDTGNASSLTMGRLTSGDIPVAFYPAAFHDLASLVLQIFPASLPLAVNGVLVALTALVWPLSVLALVRLVFPLTAPTALGTAVLSAAFSTFPILLLNFGVLYPNLYALVLVPAVYGLAARVLRLGPEPGTSWGLSLLLALLILPGLALAHPNTVMVLVGMAVPLVLAWFVDRWRAARAADARLRALVGPAALVVVYAIAATVTWKVVRPPEEAATWAPTGTAAQSLGEALLNASPGDGRAAWLVSILVIAGIVVAVRRGIWWLAGSWAVVVGLWVVVAGVGQGPLRMFLTGPWYNDPWRFSAMVTIAALPLAVLAVQAATDALGARLSGPLRGATAGVLAVAVAVVLVAGTQRAPYLDEAVERAAWMYALAPDSPLVNSDEYALLMRVPAQVPADAVVATNPWNGSSMLYALTGVHTTTTHILYTTNPALTEVRDHLDEIDTRPEACQATEQLRVTHVLDFGDQEVHYASNPYPGFDALADAPGFHLVDHEGSARLYELTQCR